MAAPLFYAPVTINNPGIITLDEETSKHIVQVLRMTKGELIELTDGKGNKSTASIEDPHKKKCTVTIIVSHFQPPPGVRNAVAISPLKNSARFEWFVEKATEIGVAAIIPIICERTEKQQMRVDRIEAVITSAMLQSQQSWKPVLNKLVEVSSFINTADYQNKFIAHCAGNNRSTLTDQNKSAGGSRLILIGPEGDFTENEIAQAMANNFLPVTLGNTRLRSETAGVVAATLLQTL